MPNMPANTWVTFLKQHRADSRTWRGKRWSNQQVLKRVARAWNSLPANEKTAEVDYILNGTGAPRTLAQLYPPPASVGLNAPFGPIAPPPAAAPPTATAPAIPPPAPLPASDAPPPPAGPTQAVSTPIVPSAGPGPGASAATTTVQAGESSRPHQTGLAQSTAGTAQVGPPTGSQPACRTDEVSGRDLPRNEKGDDGSFGNSWHGMWNIGNGRNKAYIAVQVDGDSNVQRRLVVKDTDLSKDGYNHAWKDERRWYVPPGESSDSRQPMEYALQRRLCERDGQHVARVLAYSLNNASETYRLYFDYCDQGNSGDLIQRYQQEKRRIPEALLWHLFESLAYVTLMMKQGDATTPVDGWKEIIHRDLKPDNLLLHGDGLGHYPAYPTPKLSDFEFATETTPDDKDNPNKYLDENAGQLGYKAPEAQSAGFEMEGSNATKLLAHTNIWGVGAILLSLMNEETIDEFEDDPSLEGKSNVYTKQLRDLVTRCISRVPGDRPKPEDLLREIRRLTSGEEDLVSGLRSNPEPQDDEMDWEYINLQDAYPVGMSLVDLQRRQDEKKRKEQDDRKERERREKDQQERERQENERREKERQEKERQETQKGKEKEKTKQTKPPRPPKPRVPKPPSGGSTSDDFGGGFGGFGGGLMFSKPPGQK